MSTRAPSRPPKPKAPAGAGRLKPADKPNAPAAAPTEPKSDDEAVALKPFAQAHSRRAIEALAAVMTDPTAPPVARISAATTLLTWGHGRPQGEGECAQASRAEPVIKLRWANSEAKPEKRRAQGADRERTEGGGEAREILIELPYRPRALQQVLHRRMRRFNVIVCHRRFGKSVLGVNHLIRAAARSPHPRPRFAYLAPYYKQAKSVAWDYLKHFTQAIPGVRQNESELRVDLPNGARLSLLGADNPDALRGIYLDGVVLDEFGQMAPRVFSEIVRPALADREGFAIFIGTPKGRNGFYQLYERAKADRRWFTALYKASETGILSAEELADAREMMTADEYAQEFECSFQAAVAGAYYAALVEQAEEQGRIGNVPWDPRLPVHTAWISASTTRRRSGSASSTVLKFASSIITNPRASGSTTTRGCCRRSAMSMATISCRRTRRCASSAPGGAGSRRSRASASRRGRAARSRSRTASTRCG